MKIYIDDCRNVIGTKVKKVDYVLTVPPDFEEIELNGKEENKYIDFLSEIILKLLDVSSLITVCITDRKYKGTIIPKHKFIIDIFLSNNWVLKSHKLWLKSDKINLYRLTYMHIMTFSVKSKKKKSNNIREMFFDFFRIDPDFKTEDFDYGQPIDLFDIYIRNFTAESEVVFDPFSGSGSVCLASLLNNRRFVGCEINRDYAKLTIKRLNRMKQRIFTDKSLQNKKIRLINAN